ncbi:MAG: branched-chain amino acid ABC transporter permease LivH, partial [Alphaproteobacteria bacterium]|nr:branched-chain amino acid ABC transporter permease LivH [Alphaproteobacteria bacterium]
MEYFVQQLVNGITLGSVYGLIAIGYTMVYGIIGMINFAHGDVFMIGAFMTLILMISFGISGASDPLFITIVLPLILISSMFLTSVWGWTIERIAYRPLRGSFRLAPLITAIGVSIVLQNLVQISQGGHPKPLQPIITGGYELLRSEIDGRIFSAQISNVQIMIILTTLFVMIGFSLLINKTALGRAQRACEQDRIMAALLGINVDRIISLTFMIGAALASVAGMMYLLYYGLIDFFVGFTVGKSFYTNG